MATVWTDTIIAGVTKVRAVHFNELGVATDKERARRGLAPLGWSSSTYNGQSIKKQHLDDLRSYNNYAAGALTDPTITAGSTRIRKVHIDELRAKVNSLENHPKVGGSTDCNAGCTGLCVGCSGTCTGSCTSCSGCSGSCTGTCTSCSSCTGSCSGSCKGGCSSCSGDSCTSCFPAGTKVLMGDLSEKNIEEVIVGDEVFGLDCKRHKVVALYPTKLGRDRALFQFEDKSLAWSGEHPLWIRTNEEEYWGVHDYNAYIREIYGPQPDVPVEYRNYGLKKKEPIVIVKPVEYAHVSGWKRHEVCIDRAAGTDMPLFDLIIDGPGTMICNGYVVSAFASDERHDFSRVRWDGLKCRPL